MTNSTPEKIKDAAATTSSASRDDATAKAAEARDQTAETTKSAVTGLKNKIFGAVKRTTGA